MKTQVLFLALHGAMLLLLFAMFNESGYVSGKRQASEILVHKIR